MRYQEQPGTLYSFTMLKLQFVTQNENIISVSNILIKHKPLLGLQYYQQQYYIISTIILVLILLLQYYYQISVSVQAKDSKVRKLNMTDILYLISKPGLVIRNKHAHGYPLEKFNITYLCKICQVRNIKGKWAKKKNMIRHIANLITSQL